jgi:TetR/AcrR family transcriptional regulator, transcriptional repressor for nem operon
VKISKEKAAENRAVLVRTASRLFREKGLDGVGVAEICKEAGLTHGALYAHFASKDELAIEALGLGLDQGNALLFSATVEGMPDLSAFLDYYLSAESRDNPGNHCVMAATMSEIGRHDKAMSARFSEGFLVLVRAFERHLARKLAPAAALDQALAAVGALAGGLAMSRATAKANPAMSDRMLAATRRAVDDMLAVPGDVRPPTPA